MESVVYIDNLTGLVDDPGLYLQLDDDDDSALPFVEGSGDKLRRYHVTLAAIQGLNLLPRVYNASVRLGDYEARTDEDQILTAFPFRWNGLRESSLNSGGGFLRGIIGHTALAPDNTLEIIQGEAKTILFAIEPNGRFDLDVFEEITVKFADPDGTVVTKTEDDGAVERVTQEYDIQVIRCTLDEDDTRELTGGLLHIEIAFDSQKVRMSHAMRIAEELGDDAS